MSVRLQTGSFDYVYAEGQYEVVYYTHTFGTELTSIADMRAAGCAYIILWLPQTLRANAGTDARNLYCLHICFI
jgi:hypothetical protein